MANCLVALGSNLGDRQATLDRALAALAALPDTTLLAQSRYHETPAVGGPVVQSDYLNAAALVETSLDPLALLDELQRIERGLGRERREHWGPRTIDLDLLLYDDVLMRTERLALPHPRFAVRRFALEPAAEVAPQMVHPRIGWTVARLLAHLDTAAPYVALAGIPGAGTSDLAERLATATSGIALHDPISTEATRAKRGDRASRSTDIELEFVAVRRDALAGADWTDHGGPVVSDYWLGQSLADASLWLAGNELKEFRAAWQALADAAIAPKLIAYVDATPADDTLARLREALLAELDRPSYGPVLCLERAKPAEQLAELVAAVAAMK